MSIDSKIRSAITPIVSVCVPHLYNGTKTEYCTYNFTRYPTDFCDNAPMAIGYSIQLHYFLPSENNPNNKLAQLESALFAAGFDYPQIVDATDNVSQHYVFETGIIEERAWEQQ